MLALMTDVLAAVRGSRVFGPGRSQREYVDLVVDNVPIAGLGSVIGDRVRVLVTDWASGLSLWLVL